MYGSSSSSIGGGGTCPQTPPRRSVRGSILTPSCVPAPYVTPSKHYSNISAVAQSRSRVRGATAAAAAATVASTLLPAVPRTPLARNASAAGTAAASGAGANANNVAAASGAAVVPMHPSGLLLSTPQRRRRPQHQLPTPGGTPSRGGTAAAAHHASPGTMGGGDVVGNAADDRFIPSRRQTHLDLCRRALLSGEKRPRPPGFGNSIAAPVGAGGDAAAAATTTNSPSTTTSPSSSRHGASETPLQKEFKRRMLSSLCNVPLTMLNEDGEPLGLLNFRSENHGGGGNGGGGGGSNSFRSNPISSHNSNSHSNQSSNVVASWQPASSSATPIRPSPLQSHAPPLLGTHSRRLGPMHHHQTMSGAGNPFSHDLFRTMKLGENAVYGTDSATASAEDLSVAKKVLRKVPSAPFRILDAPDIVDDYYLNLISWSKDNVLAVALAQSVYLWNATTGDIHHLVTLDTPTDYVTSVCWSSMPGNTHWIAVGTNSCAVHLFDAKALQKLRTFGGHAGRVSSLAWNQHWITSGSRDAAIHNHDVRAAAAASSSDAASAGGGVVAKYRGHQQEVCGLKWNEDGTTLASGGNENYLCLWDAAMSGRDRGPSSSNGGGPAPHRLSDLAPRLVLKKHRAAVKALDWCPFHRGLLASGGGTSDRTIKFWSSNSGALLNSVDTGSQVCSIVWSRHHRELCSSHGYSENQLILWKYPTMARIKELPGHTARVLNMEASPDGTSVVSAAADETLRFWNVFGCPSSHRKPSSLLAGDIGSFGTPTIR